MSAPSSRGRRLGRRMWSAARHDIGRKLTALLMATSLWMVLQNLVISTQPLDLPVKSVATQAEADQQGLVTAGVYLIVPDELIVRKVSDPRVHLRVAGLRDDVLGLSMSARLLFTVADLGGADEITLSRPLEREAFDSTGQVEPHLTSFRVRPEVLQVTLARRDRAEVTLTADSVATVGSPKPGYLFRSSRIGLQPSAVSLTGPARVIEQLVQDPARIKLAPVDIAGRSAAVSQSVGLAEDLVQQGVSIEGQGEVLVTVPIEADDIVKPLVRVPIEYRNEGVLQERRVRATAPQAVDIQVVGPPLEINSRTDEDLLASIVLVFDWKAVPDSYFKTNQATYKVGAYTLDLPDTVSVADSKGNKEIKIEFTIEPLGPPGAVDGK